MLAVIGLEVSFSSVNGIDVFDYHLYRNKPITLDNENQNKIELLVNNTVLQIQKEIERYHLVASQVHFIFLDENDQVNHHAVANTEFHFMLKDKLNVPFASDHCSDNLNHALNKAKQLCGQANVVVSNEAKVSNDGYDHCDAINIADTALILSVNLNHLDGVTTLLLCDQEQNDVNSDSMLGRCHTYANINTSSISPVVSDSSKNYSKSNSKTFVSDHITQFLGDNDLTLPQIESIITDQQKSGEKQRDWLIAYEETIVSNKILSNIPSTQQVNRTELSNTNPTTLLTPVNVVSKVSENFDSMLSLVASILCLDQRYRIGSSFDIIGDDNADEESRWAASPYYCLAKSTSYLTTNNTSDDIRRNIIISHGFENAHQLIWVSEASNKLEANVTNVKEQIPSKSADQKNACDGDDVQQIHTIRNGFLAQHPIKPVIFNGPNLDALLISLNEVLASFNETTAFVTFCERQYLHDQQFKSQSESTDPRQNQYYCLVLLATSYETLAQQIKLALSGVTAAVESQKPWKTPAGSYFSGKLVNKSQEQLPLSFVYPGIGSLYVGMGQDLLRLFPECYPYLSTITDDLSTSLQDKLITPRLLKKPDFKASILLEQTLRSELANIAEAGVSYACLLTAIFQQQFGLTASSTAGYSMGEVSMFAAQGCWDNPTILSKKIRSSDIFTQQLSGPLMRLKDMRFKDAWYSSDDIPQNEPLDSNNKTLWESFHLKASKLQVEAVIGQFPHVYITIINTDQSLVIAGDPKQCKSLAKQLGVRAIALNVHNIIHCPLAKSEYEKMQALYSLPVSQKRVSRLFSSSCYLPVPATQKAIAVSISKCLTEPVDFPRLINALKAAGETVFIEMGAGKSLGTWIDRILKNSTEQITCLSANQKNSDDYSAIVKTIGPLISLGYPINCQSFFSGSLIRPVKK